MAYKLTLTAKDLETIAFVGNRYSWSDALKGLSEGENLLTEPEAWEISEAFGEEIEGGHSIFPMLDARSELAGKLARLLEEIV